MYLRSERGKKEKLFLDLPLNLHMRQKFKSSRYLISGCISWGDFIHSFIQQNFLYSMPENTFMKSSETQILLSLNEILYITK